MAFFLLLLVLAFLPSSSSSSSSPTCPSETIAIHILSRCTAVHPTMECCAPLVWGVDGVDGGPWCLCNVAAEATKRNVSIGFAEISELYFRCGGLNEEEVKRHKCAGPKLSPPVVPTVKLPPPHNVGRPFSIPAPTNRRFHLSDAFIYFLDSIIGPLVLAFMIAVFKSCGVCFAALLKSLIIKFNDFIKSLLDRVIPNSQDDVCSEVELVEVVSQFEQEAIKVAMDPPQLEIERTKGEEEGDFHLELHTEKALGKDSAEQRFCEKYKNDGEKMDDCSQLEPERDGTTPLVLEVAQ